MFFWVPTSPLGFYLKQFLGYRNMSLVENLKYIECFRDMLILWLMSYEMYVIFMNNNIYVKMYT